MAKVPNIDINVTINKKSLTEITETLLDHQIEVLTKRLEALKALRGSVGSKDA